MLALIDRFLNSTTMYRLMVYYLGGLLLVAIALSALGFLPHNPLYLFASAAFLIAMCWLVNSIFAYAWDIPPNTESSLITALILALIITPASPLENAVFLAWAAVLAIVSKYLISLGKRHIFNPAAFAVALTAFGIHQSASWWVGGTLVLLPFVLIGGLLVVRKLHRTDLVLAFIVAALASSLLNAPPSLDGMTNTLMRALQHSPLLFFAFVMITEPLTTPPRRTLRIIYGALVGALFAPWVHIGSVYSTPELALIVGNVFSFAVSPRLKGMYIVREVRSIARDTYEFILDGVRHSYLPGQYAEFTLPADKSDSRGNRRYFTLASSPTETGLRLGIKFYPKPSTFKSVLAEIGPGDSVLVGSLAGDFTRAQDADEKSVYIAGGIGITPFRSMIKHQHDTLTQRDSVLLYANTTEQDIAYRDIFDAAAAAHIGFRAFYTLSQPPAEWAGERGHIDAAMIRRLVPDFRTRTFYISGPHAMVEAYRTLIKSMGVPHHRIKVDFFPGFA